MNWRRLSYSICLAMNITAISYLLWDRGDEFVLLPGLFGQVMFNGMLLGIPTGDDFISLPSGAYLVLNVTFYSSVIFAALWLMTWIRDTRRV